MYMVGAHIISKLSGMLYQAFASSRLFAPLNMSSTTFYPSDAMAAGKFTQFWAGNNGRRIPAWFSDEDVPLLSGAGGVMSSVTDMVGQSRL